jgi:hypothetical protein
MLTALLLAAITFLLLVVLLWVGTAWAQGYFYETTTEDLYWRAPAAAGALALFYLLWLAFESRRPNTTDTIFRFSHEDSQAFDRFISVRRNEEGEQEIVFEKRGLGAGRFEFRDRDGRPWARSRSGMMIAIIVEEPNEDPTAPPVRRRFNAELSPDGKTFATRQAGGTTQPIRYIEENGTRFIVEDQLGKIISYRRGRLVLNLLVNLIHWIIWFVVLWLLLEFPWPHALFGGSVCWLVMTLGVLPFLLDRVRERVTG